MGKAVKQQELATKKSETFDELIGTSKKDLNNVDLIVRQIIRKADDVNKAEKLFDTVHRSIGVENKLGRVFTEEDVTEAWLRCQAFFEEQAEKARLAAEAEAAEGDGSSSSGSGGSSSSDSSRP